VNLSIFDKKKQKGISMIQRFGLIAAGVTFGTAALAHPGAHIHPHDGAHWLTLVSALGVIALAGGLAIARARSRK
jgi:hypothetical protein